jgi:hypothetical protein
VQDHELDEVYDYIKRHLQGEIGRWTEVEVSNQVKNWRIEQTMVPVEPTPTHEPEEAPNSSDIDYPKYPISTPQVREKAKRRLQEIDNDALRSAITSLCELENDAIIEILLKYV